MIAKVCPIVSINKAISDYGYRGYGVVRVSVGSEDASRVVERVNGWECKGRHLNFTQSKREWDVEEEEEEREGMEREEEEEEEEKKGKVEDDKGEGNEKRKKEWGEEGEWKYCGLDLSEWRNLNLWIANELNSLPNGRQFECEKKECNRLSIELEEKYEVISRILLH